jgi:epoxyqueuosine reductase
MMRQHLLAAQIKDAAVQLGFLHCGIAKAVPLDEDARRLEAWLSQGFHGKMDYMERNFDLRTNPSKLVPGAKSVITLTANYFPAATQQQNAPVIAKYAYGIDYHEVLRDKLHQLLSKIRALTGEVQGRGFVDSAPVLERSWAVRSGIGWVGKNGNLIAKKQGSFFFIATFITDLEIEPDGFSAAGYCGTCTRCIDACPTGAIVAPTVIDARKCISYLTIELKDELIPNEFHGKMHGWLFGCDICQDVCPWNRFSKPHTNPDFNPLPEITDWTFRDWEHVTLETFNRVFKHSPLKRTKWKGIMRNLKVILPNNSLSQG